MKVKFTAEITMNIPGEFQDDALAVRMITKELEDLLEVNTSYDKYEQPELMFLSVQLKSYFPGAGKL
jgi:hypothetical protein